MSSYCLPLVPGAFKWATPYSPHDSTGCEFELCFYCCSSIMQHSLLDAHAPNVSYNFKGVGRMKSTINFLILFGLLLRQ